MFRLAGVLERMTVFENRCYAASARAKDWRIRKAKVRIQTSLSNVSSLLEIHEMEHLHNLTALSTEEADSRYSQDEVVEMLP